MSRNYLAKRLAREQDIPYTEALRRIRSDAEPTAQPVERQDRRASGEGDAPR